MQFKEDPRNLIVPLELTKIIYSEWDAEQAILDRPDQVYGKALHGTGRVVFKNGNIYKGDFHNGMLHGRGNFIWTSGVIYDGEFTYNKITGQGTYTWPDGSIYAGTVLNGLRHGDGKFVASGETAIYQGQWQEGLRNGMGKVIFKSGAIYDGEFVQGNKQGRGRMTYPTQNFYEGAFTQDKKCGSGVMNWISSSEKYSGNWEENSQNGWGTHIWLEAKGEGGKFLRNRYEGEWVSGERCGSGVFFYANGAKYIGEWDKNMKQGLAMFVTDAGGLILGLFKQDRLSQVYMTSDNEQKSGMIPKEIAPKSREEQEHLQEQISKANTSYQKPKTNENSARLNKKGDKKEQIQADKLIGLNAPNVVVQQNIPPRSIEANPYASMIDFTDLFRGHNNFDLAQIELNVQTMLLRHNSTLRQWYKFFSNKYEATLSENTFALNFEGFWKIIRDSKLLNVNFNLASLNRLFFQGVKTKYPLTYNQSELKNQLDFMKKNLFKLNLSEMEDIFHMQFSMKVQQSLRDKPLDYDDLTDQNEELSFNKNAYDIHDSQNIVLYRHFVELLVRMAYLKYNSLPELHRAIERIIINKLTPLYDRKMSKGINQSQEESHVSLKMKINFEDYIKDLKPLFDKYCKDRVRPQFGVIDRTVMLGDVFYILERSEKFNEADKMFIVTHIEKNFDQDEGILNQISNLEQSSVQLAQSKDDKAKRRKQGNQDTSHNGPIIESRDKDANLKSLLKIDKWTQYLDYELILYEFTDIMITHMARKHKDLSHSREEGSKVQAILNRLILIEPYVNKQIYQARVLQNSAKDQQKEDLKLKRLQQEERQRNRLKLEEERRREERERNLMALEDQDVKSDFEEERDSDEEDDNDY